MGKRRIFQTASLLLLALAGLGLGSQSPRRPPAGPDLTPAIHEMIQQGLQRGPVIHNY